MTPRHREAHLTDAQFGDLLAGEAPDAATATHLAACSHCRGEIAAVRGSLNGFNACAATWSEKQAALRIPVPSWWTLHMRGGAAGGGGLAATAAAGLLLFDLGLPTDHVPQQPMVSAAALTGPTSAELADDNRLMASINQELRYDDGSAVANSPSAAAGSALRVSEPRSEHRFPVAVNN